MENLEIAGYTLSKNALVNETDKVLSKFSILEDRKTLKANVLSSGEQQILAIACSLITNPRILILDEPTLNLSRKLSNYIFSLIRALNTENKISVIMVEQKVAKALEICPKAYFIKDGYIKFSGPSMYLLKDDSILTDLYLEWHIFQTIIFIDHYANSSDNWLYWVENSLFLVSILFMIISDWAYQGTFIIFNHLPFRWFSVSVTYLQYNSVNFIEYLWSENKMCLYLVLIWHSHIFLDILLPTR